MFLASTSTSTSSVLLLLLLSISNQQGHAQRQSPTSGEIMGRRVTKTLRMLSPLQSFTIFPKEVTATATTPRDGFLPKFQAGLTAETKTREQLARRRELLTNNGDGYDEISSSGAGWEKKMEERERLRVEREEDIADRAWDRATAQFENNVSPPAATAAGSGSKFQFVGVIQPPNSEKKVKWYARKRPKDSKWNIRMLHVNRDAIVRDMFTSGKVDIMGKYINTGESLDEVKEGEAPSLRPRIKGEYSVKPRSLLNLWNFSPKHFFTDSSGAFWRERRLPPGLYTDGRLVYESSYRYTDGKNGMKPISKLDALLKSKSIKSSIKNKLMKRLKNDSPDIVIED